MPFTQQEATFLKRAKDDGKSYEEAMSILNKARDAGLITDSQASISEPQKERGFFGKVWDGEKQRIQQDLQAKKDFGIGLAKSAGETLAGASAAGEGFIKGVGRVLTPKALEDDFGFEKSEASVENVSQALTGKSTEQLFEADNGVQKAGKVIGDITQFAIPATKATKGVKLTQAASNATKGAKVANSLKNAGKIAGVDALASVPVMAAKEGEFNSEAAKDAAIGGAIGGGLNLAGDVLKTGSGFRKWMSDFRANRSVVSDDNIRIAKETSQSVLDDVLKQANFANANKVRGKTPLDLAGEKMKDALKNSVAPARQEVGKQLSQVIDSTDTTVQIKPILDNFTDSLKQQNVKITGDGLIFDDSTFAYSDKSKKAITDLYKKLVSNKEMNVKDVWATTQNLSGLTNLDNMSADKIATVPEGLLKRLGGQLKESMKEVLPQDSLKLFDEYGDLAETQNFLARYTKETNNAGHLLKRLYSTATPDGLLKKVDKVSEVSGINLVETTEQAKLAMELAGDTRINSLLGELADKNPDGIKYIQKFFQLIRFTDPESVARSLSVNNAGGATKNVYEEFASVAKDYLEALAKDKISE